MRGSLLAGGIAMMLAAAPAAAQTGVPVNRDWDPAARDLVGEGGALLVQPPRGGQAVSSVASVDRELARRELTPKERGGLLMLRATLNMASGNRAQADRDIELALKTDPTLKYDMVASRARVMAASGRTQPAIDLVEQALKDRPGYAPLVTTRGQVRMMQGDYAMALADFSANAATSDAARRLRAQAFYVNGNYRDAVEDIDYLLQSGSGVAPAIHLVLWRYANHVKLGRDARALLIADLRAYGEPASWPGQIARFLAGRMTAGELEIAAEADAEARRSDGRCLASYFIAMDSLRQRNRSRARELLRLTQVRCPIGHFANWAATAELRRL